MCITKGGGMGSDGSVDIDGRELKRSWDSWDRGWEGGRPRAAENLPSFIINGPLHSDN